MSTNLVVYVMQFLTPDMVGRIATALGLNRNDAQSGVSAAVPALLAAFSGLAEKPGGAQSLVNTTKQQSGVVDNFASMIGGSNQASFTERGSSLLTSLLGSHDSAALAGAVGRSAGIGQTRATPLLGMLAPLIMGLIGKQIGMRGVDVGSLTSLLASQKDQIAQALPPGMGQMLESAGVSRGLEQRGAAAPAAAAPAGRPGDQYRPAPGDQYRSPSDQYRRPVTTDRTTRTEPGGPGWLYWLLPLAVLGAIIWYLVSRPYGPQQARQEAPPPPAPTQQQRAPQTTGQAPPGQQPTAGQNVVVGGVDVTNTLGDGLADVRTSLQSVTDVGSAQAALPKLEAAKSQIDKVKGLMGQLSPDQRKTLAGVASTQMPTIDQLSDKVLGLPGVGDVLKPTIDPLKSELAELSSGQPTTTGAGR